MTTFQIAAGRSAPTPISCGLSVGWSGNGRESLGVAHARNVVEHDISRISRFGVEKHPMKSFEVGVIVGSVSTSRTVQAPIHGSPSLRRADERVDHVHQIEVSAQRECQFSPRDPWRTSGVPQ